MPPRPETLALRAASPFASGRISSSPFAANRASRPHRAKGILLGLPLLIAFVSGCVSSHYQRADGPISSPPSLHLQAEAEPLAAELHSVIWRQGPGSWKRDAWWDEYVVSVRNTGPRSLVLEGAALSDFRRETTSADDRPWILEADSRSYADRVNREAKQVLIVAGSVVGTSFATVAAMGAIGAGGALVTVAALPAYLIGVKLKNTVNRRAIEDEFHRRRLQLPATLAPGETVQGSLFFRLSPGPTELSLRARDDQATRLVTVDLPPLAGLHLADGKTSH